ncbi:DUF1905 domain-containing protein [Arthrobacter sp. HMWF013]|uniref:DUF1905 domain-containing protein n=1 Tax=Arthrobacter sp. HMWF013 TaxID=2056849 RepID=UPI0015E7EF80|nr:DUF1905 domain-containing protein [Arthrobacter sp. HMWF013]
MRPRRRHAILAAVTSSYSFRAELWLYPGEAGWHFLTVPPDVAEELREQGTAFRKAFGAVKVTAEISGHTWQTSVFPDSASGSFLLPVKKTVRAAAHVSAGDEVEVRLTVLGDG